MGFLKKFFRGVFHEGAQAAPTHSSFEQLSRRGAGSPPGRSALRRLRADRRRPPVVRPEVVPSRATATTSIATKRSKTKVPVLMAAASRENLFDMFMELLEPLGDVVDVVLETSHNRESAGHTDLYREHIDMPVLKSMLWDYEDLLVNDGCTGIAVLNPTIPQEVQFDEHKLLIVYGKPLRGLRSTSSTASASAATTDEVHHRSRARPLVERQVLPAVRRAEDAAGHGLRVLKPLTSGQGDSLPGIHMRMTRIQGTCPSAGRSPSAAPAAANERLRRSPWSPPGSACGDSQAVASAPGPRL